MGVAVSMANKAAEVLMPYSLPSEFASDSEVTIPSSLLSVSVHNAAEDDGSVSTKSDIAMAVFYAQNEYTEAGASAGCLRCLQLLTKGKSSIKHMMNCPFKQKSSPSKLSGGHPLASLDVSMKKKINAEKTVTVFVEEGSTTNQPILVDNIHEPYMSIDGSSDMVEGATSPTRESLDIQEPYMSIDRSSGMVEDATSSTRECITYHGPTNYCLPCKDRSLMNQVAGADMNEVVSQM
jgi:hypothetical protein